MRKSWKGRLLAGALSLSLALNLVLLSTPLAANIETSHRYQQILQNVLHYIRALYPADVEEKALFVGAIRGMLSATQDPYSRFLDTEEHKAFNAAEGGQRVGVGVEVTMRGNLPVVIAPVAGSPAEKSGIRPGDTIIHIDGVSTENKEFTKILDLISGEQGSIVKLTIKRGSVRFDLSIERGLFDLEYCSGEKLGDYGYIRLAQFYGEESGSVAKFRNLLLEFQRSRGLIIDLRNNTGGHLSMAATITSFFLKEGQDIVHARGREGRRTIQARGETNLAGNLPVVILVNEGSASASEIMAGALQDHKRALLVGVRTFGKASVQRIIRPLPADTALILTTQHYYTPHMRNIQGQGLSPDIIQAEISPTEEESFYIKQIKKRRLVLNFRKTQPGYAPEAAIEFEKFLAAYHYTIRRPLLDLMLRQEFGALKRVDVESDLQLARAVDALKSGK